MRSIVIPKLTRTLVLLTFAVGVLVTVSCANPEWQGWSGITYDEGILYLGSMDGKVLAINPEARKDNLPFPSAGEWAFPFPTLGAARPVCGPTCASPAPVANVYATPLVAGELVYLATCSGESGRILAINRSAPGYAEGTPMRSKGEWVYPSGVESMGAVVGSPVLYDGALYFGSSNGKVYSLDAMYGEKRWVFDTGGKIWTSPAIRNDVLYVSNYRHKLYALSVRDGTLLWEKEFPASVSSSPVISGDRSFFGTFDCYLYALDVTSGDVKWKFKGGNWFWATPVVKGGVVYAACLDNKVYALKADTPIEHGEVLWEFTSDSPLIATPALVGDRLVVSSKSGKVYVLRTDNGSLETTVAVGAQIMAPLCAVDNMLYVHARDRCIYGINVEKGEVVWKFSSVIK